MKQLLIALVLVGSGWAFTLVEDKAAFVVNKDTAVWELLKQLGEPAPNHTVNTSIDGVSAERGEDLVRYGITVSPKGKKTRKQSKHFVCTSCHNIVKEDPDLRVADPQARLEYAAKNQLPYLQGTTLYGAVNRQHFYNGDYEKKYGDLVAPARQNLREAIQLCAVECSQGRRLNSWEMESVLAYLWTLQYKLGDLDMETSDYQTLEAATQGGDKTSAREKLKSFYLDFSPAHFVAPPENLREGYPLAGNPDNGELIYKLSCLHCHENKRYSYFHLDVTRQTFKYLVNNFDNYAHSSIYEASRYGTPPLYGKRAYMPQYTEEKMTNQQMEDLRAYIEQGAKRGYKQ
ncbi:MAG: cytochrome c [Bacteroidota bacterium]